jgi:hypothetical protein
MDIHAPGGARETCEDLRAGCANLRPAGADCGPADFGYVAVATRPDDGTNPLVSGCATATRARRNGWTWRRAGWGRRWRGAGFRHR